MTVYIRYNRLEQIVEVLIRKPINDAEWQTYWFLKAQRIIMKLSYELKVGKSTEIPLELQAGLKNGVPNCACC